MSLAIDVDKVCAVLLADGWHQVDWARGRDGQWSSSFSYDAYEYTYGDHYVQDDKNSSTGYEFWEGMLRVCGPMLAILSVKVYSEEQSIRRGKKEEREWQEAEKNAILAEAELAVYRASQQDDAPAV